MIYEIYLIHSFGYEEYNNTKCAIGEFRNTDSNVTITIWLDTNKGTCLKVVNNGIDSYGNPYEYVDECVATYGIVTDEDVKKPDLTEYTLIEITNVI